MLFFRKYEPMIYFELWAEARGDSAPNRSRESFSIFQLSILMIIQMICIWWMDKSKISGRFQSIRSKFNKFFFSLSSRKRIYNFYIDWLVSTDRSVQVGPRFSFFCRQTALDRVRPLDPRMVELLSVDPF